MSLLQTIYVFLNNDNGLGIVGVCIFNLRISFTSLGTSFSTKMYAALTFKKLSM